MKKTNTIATISKKANAGFDKMTKAAGMNYFERRKFKKTCKNFGYDVGVNVASTLVLDTVGLIAHGTGVAVGTAYLGVKKGISKISNAVSDKAEDIKAQHEIKKAEKAAKKHMEAEVSQKIEEIAEEVAEAFEEEADADEEVATED